jgi:hypothetical protein
MHPKTFAKLPTWTSQEVFDYVVAALRKQGKPSMGSDGECKYLNPEGLKCAVGHLIPPDLYSKDMEDNNVLGLKDKFPQLKNITPHYKLLRDLQYAHDGWSYNIHKENHLKLFEERLQGVASKFKLTYTPPLT